MIERKKMKCLECGWVGYEDELQPHIYKEQGRCPKCYTVVQKPSLCKY